MVGDDQLGALVPVDLATQSADRPLHADQQLGGELAEAADESRPQCGELTTQIGRAALDLVRQRVAILGRTALEHIADVDGVSRQRHAGNQSRVVHGFDDPGQQLAGASDEGLSAAIFVGAGGFPDDHLVFTRDLPEIYATGVPALNVFIKVVVGVAAAISMLVILLAMYTTVTERTRQIGILKSLGMSKSSIAWVIEQEAIIVSFLGVAVGVGLTLLARLAVERTTSLKIDIELRWVLVALAVGLVGGTIGALYPALRAARQDAVEALSYE